MACADQGTGLDAGDIDRDDMSLLTNEAHGADASVASDDRDGSNKVPAASS
jgi:hypothetical protein